MGGRAIKFRWGWQSGRERGLKTEGRGRIEEIRLGSWGCICMNRNRNTIREAMVDFVPIIDFPSVTLPFQKMNAAGFYSTHSPPTICFQISVELGNAYSSSSRSESVRNHCAPSVGIKTYDAPSIEV